MRKDNFFLRLVMGGASGSKVRVKHLGAKQVLILLVDSKFVVRGARQIRRKLGSPLDGRKGEGFLVLFLLRADLESPDRAEDVIFLPEEGRLLQEKNNFFSEGSIRTTRS